MSDSTSYIPEAYRSATEIADRVRTGEESAVAVLEGYLARIEQVDSDLHAFNTVTSEQALAQAEAIDRAVANGEDPGPLAGVPVALKDNLCTRGVTTTCSSNMLKDWVPPYDATVVQRLAAAGAIAVGKTNLDEFAMGSSTENSAFGPTKNPHDTTRVPGGSSGGSAAAVAAGLAPVALGSDTGGSIRQPAALCGVVGVKPTYGTVSRLGLIAFASSLDQIGPFTNNIADSIRVLETIGGHDTGDSTSIPSAFPTAGIDINGDVSGMRIGIISEMMADGISPSTAARVRAAAEQLAGAGAKVEEVSVPSVGYALSAYYLVAPAEASSNLARFDGVRFGARVDADSTSEMMELTRTQGFGPEVKRRIMLGTYALSAGYYDAFYGKALKVRTLIRNAFNRVYEDFDALIAPTSPFTAFKFGAKSDDLMAMYTSDVCTGASNLVGHPSMSVPYGTDENNLPIGVQILAPSLGEVAMFRVGLALEGGAQ